MRIVRKKTWPPAFNEILEGKKRFDVRLNDFEVDEGDILVLEEFDSESGEYTGRKIKKRISYILRTNEAKYWNKEEVDEKGFVVMSLEDEK